MSEAASLSSAVSSVPSGGWAVAVSGGADSVALLALLRGRSDLQLHVAHLDHQIRGEQSAADARFVGELAQRWALPCTIATRSELEATIPPDSLPANPSARYRMLRLELFRRVVTQHHLQGVILAHHADDQAETIFHRLLRDSRYAGLAGMSPRTVVGGLVLLRPLLGVRREQLRQYLIEQNLSWREDPGNRSTIYLRNRIRMLLSRRPGLVQPLLELGQACAVLRDWARAAAPVLPERMKLATLARLPGILAYESARRWLLDRGVPAHLIDPSVVARLIAMARDAATPARQHFPGRLLVRRRGGEIFAEHLPPQNPD
ncbi:tRNA lysidine(34) synthetase TilS [Fontivita pretiosa]|uniref:tRNA lysidine(34) synthetase TilS n=1 Tax=Fontivita pretiosa TaxID=2989684 RepID=UPI003D16B595